MHFQKILSQYSLKAIDQKLSKCYPKLEFSCLNIVENKLQKHQNYDNNDSDNYHYVQLKIILYMENIACSALKKMYPEITDELLNEICKCIETNKTDVAFENNPYWDNIDKIMSSPQTEPCLNRSTEICHFV